MAAEMTVLVVVVPFSQSMRSDASLFCLFTYSLTGFRGKLQAWGSMSCKGGMFAEEAIKLLQTFYDGENLQGRRIGQVSVVNNE